MSSIDFESLLRMVTELIVIATAIRINVRMNKGQV